MKLVSGRGNTAAYFKDTPWATFLVVAASLFCGHLSCVHAQQQGTASPKQTVERNVGLRAQSTLLLNLDDVINATLRHHPALKAEMQERVAADGALLSAEGAFDPSI
jgi:hypothetical protein